MFNIDRALKKITGKSNFDKLTDNKLSNSSFKKMTNIPSFNTAKFLTAHKPKNIGNSVGLNFALPNFSFINNKGASIQKQKQWKNMSSIKRNVMRNKYKDTDGDRIPDRFDCSPFNTMRQDWKLPEGFNKEGVDKHGRKIVYMPTEELYYMRGRYGPGGNTTTNIYGDNYKVGKEMDEIGFKDKWQNDYENKEYEDYVKQRDIDIINYQTEIKKRELEKQDYKVYPNKIGTIKGGMFGNTKKFGTTLKFRSTPQKYQRDINIVMQPTNFAPESSSGDRTSQKVKTYYQNLKQDLETGEIPMMELSDSEIRRGVTGTGRHRILAARELGIKEIPVVVDDITATKRLQNYSQGLQKEKHKPDKTKAWIIPNVNDNEFYTKETKLKELSKQEAKQEIYNKYKDEFKSNKKNNNDYDTEIELLLLRHQIENEATDNYLKNEEGASIEKQNEWKEMPQVERNIERQNKVDTDGDRIPDEYDCCPDNVMKQDTIHEKWLNENKTFGFAGASSKDSVINFEIKNKPILEITKINKPKNNEEIQHNMMINKLKNKYQFIKNKYNFENINNETETGTNYIFYKPEHKDRAIETKKLVNNTKNKQFNYKYHRELGATLGYTEDEINQFNQKLRTIEQNEEGASIEKQNEWKEMPQVERNIERQNKVDTDGDRIPDEYDCCPDNVVKQDTQIYLDRNTKKTAFVVPSKYPDDIYLGDMEDVDNVDRASDILHHEEMHKVLYDEFGDYTSRGYDYITAPNLKPYNWSINPKTSGNLYGSPDAAKEALHKELAQKSYAYNPWEKKLNENYYGSVKERLQLAKEYMTEDEKRNLGLIKEEPIEDQNAARNALLGGL